MAPGRTRAGRMDRRSKTRQVTGGPSRFSAVLAWSIALLVASPASALVDVRIGTCTVTVVSSGVLTASPDLRTLSTTNPGGSPARIRISTLINGSFPHITCSLIARVNCFRVTTTSPTSFTPSSPSGGEGAAFITTWRQTSGNALLDLLSAIVLNGSTDFELNLTAAKTQGTFPAGRFDAEQTVNCG